MRTRTGAAGRASARLWSRAGARLSGDAMRRVLAVILLLGAACDREPRGQGEGPPVFAEPVRIVVEAESGSVEAPFEIASDGECSGGKCVVLAEKWATDGELHPAYRTREGGRLVSAKENLSDNPRGEALVPNGSVELPFRVEKAGRYSLHVRAWLHCGCGDTFFVNVDEPAPVDTDGDGTYDENAPYTFGASTHKRWKWVRKKGVTFDLAEGPHVVRIFNREDGIKLDQILLAEMAEGPVEPYVPQGIERSHP